VSNSREVANTAGRAWATSAGLDESYEPVGDRRQVVVVGALAPAGLLVLWTVVAVYLWR